MLTTCGSTAGYLRHLWLQEESCPECAAAWVKFADTAPITRRGNSAAHAYFRPGATHMRRRP